MKESKVGVPSSSSTCPSSECFFHVLDYKLFGEEGILMLASSTNTKELLTVATFLIKPSQVHSRI